MSLIYKICTAAAPQEATRNGHFEGSADDLCDGFIHSSDGSQVVGTLARYFAGQRDLVILAVDSDRVGERLRWQPSRGGDLFPHVYGSLALDHVMWVEALPLQEDGSYLLPAGVAS